MSVFYSINLCTAMYTAVSKIWKYYEKSYILCSLISNSTLKLNGVIHKDFRFENSSQKILNIIMHYVYRDTTVFKLRNFLMSTNCFVQIYSEFYLFSACCKVFLSNFLHMFRDLYSVFLTSNLGLLAAISTYFTTPSYSSNICSLIYKILVLKFCSHILGNCK